MTSESVWPSGMPSKPRPRFDSASVLLSLQNLCFIHTVFVTLPLRINETFNCLLPLPILM